MLYRAQSSAWAARGTHEGKYSHASPFPAPNNGLKLLPASWPLHRIYFKQATSDISCSETSSGVKMPQLHSFPQQPLPDFFCRYCEFHRIMESQNALGWKGPFKAISSNPPAISRDIFNWIGLLRAPSNMAWDVSRDGASPTSLHNLCQGFTTLSVKNFFLISSLNLPSFSFRSSPLVLSLQALLKSLFPSIL